MRSGIRVVFLVLSVLTLNSQAISAQSLTPCARIGGFFGGRQVFIPGRRGQPAVAFTATLKQTFEQRLSDGNIIRWTAETTQARDESGRIFQQRIQGCDLDSNGQPQLRTQVEISDTANRTSMSWSTGPGSMMLVTISHNHPTAMPNWKDIPRTPPVSTAGFESVKEDLGTRTIAGIQATGSRTIQTLPVGWAGNDVPLKQVRETWTDPQNHAVLMTVDDDPLSGRRTWEVESLTVGPPDPALFTPPANYQVWDPDAQKQAQTTADAKQ